jgi:uncharacterized membrane protein
MDALIGLVAPAAGVCAVQISVQQPKTGHAQQGSATPRCAALDILDEAYARGDLTREAYLQKCADLSTK